jgi:phage shock protein PspC (stress-responsive transcriptional regulator)
VQLAAPPPRLYRAADGRVVAGVAQGLANHLAVKPLYVRIAFAVLATFNGFGLVVYLALWAVVPQEPVAADAPPRPRRRAFERGTALALVAVAAGGLLLARGVPILGNNILLVPLLLAGAGLAVLWSQADKDQRDRWRRMSLFETEPTRRSVAIVRFVGGAILVAAGVGSFLLLSGTLSAARDGLVAGVAVLAGLALLTAPLWWRLVAELTEERRERIRSQERADLAAHLHDSVLQTLALIQRHSDEPREVARLARGQERELRTWLYRPETGRSRSSPPPWRRSPARSRTRTSCRSRASSSATPRWTTGSGRWCRRPGRRWSTRPSTPASRRSPCTRRSSRRRSRCSSGTAAPASTPTSSTTTGTACAGRSSDGWNGTAGRRRSAARSVPARRSS